MGSQKVLHGVGASVSASGGEPLPPLRFRRALLALWVSLALHVTAIAVIQVAPPAGPQSGGPVIEARLTAVPKRVPATRPQAAEPEARPPASADQAATLPSSQTPDAQPVSAPPPQAAAAPPAIESAPEGPIPPEPASPVAITSWVDLTYYSARDLDVLPRTSSEIEPAYPEAAARQKQSGKVRLQLKLEADGHVSDVRVVSADPAGVFEESAIEAFRDVQFTPAQKGGRPVRALLEIEVGYEWEASQQ